MKKLFGLIIAITMMNTLVLAKVLVFERGGSNHCFQSLVDAKVQLSEQAIETNYKLILENGKDVEERYYLGISERNISVEAGKFFESNTSESVKIKKLFFIEAQSCAALEREMRFEARLRAIDNEMRLLKESSAEDRAMLQGFMEQQRILNKKYDEMFQKLLEAIEGNTAAVASIKADLSVLKKELSAVKQKIARCCKKGSVRKHRHRGAQKNKVKKIRKSHSSSQVKTEAQPRLNFCERLFIENEAAWFLSNRCNPSIGDGGHDNHNGGHSNTGAGGTSGGGHGNTGAGGSSAGGAGAGGGNGSGHGNSGAGAGSAG